MQGSVPQMSFVVVKMLFLPSVQTERRRAEQLYGISKQNVREQGTIKASNKGCVANKESRTRCWMDGCWTMDAWMRGCCCCCCA